MSMASEYSLMVRDDVMLRAREDDEMRARRAAEGRSPPVDRLAGVALHAGEGGIYRFSDGSRLTVTVDEIGIHGVAS